MLPAVGVHFVRVERTGRERSHAACVETGIAVASPLVVLGTAHQLVMGAVGKGQYRYLATGHELLNDDLTSRVAEFFVRHELRDACLGFFKCLADQDAFSQRQAGSLQDDGHFCVLQIGERFFGVVEDLVSGRRDPVFLHEVLGKCFAAFDDRRVRRRSEDPKSLGFERVDYARAERIVHAAYGQANVLTLGKSRERVKIHCPDRHAPGDLRDSRISGRAVKLIYLRASPESFRDRMLSSASSNQ